MQDHLVTMNDHMQDDDDDIVLENLAKEGLLSGKSKGSYLALGVQQRMIMKGLPEHSSKSGRKKDLEKIKHTGDLLVEFGFVKSIDTHFSPSLP